MLAFVFLFLVLILITFRTSNFPVPMWLAMLCGACGVLITGQISPHDAFAAINFDVILFLFGMFVVGRAMEMSGYLYSFAEKFLRFAKDPSSTLLVFMYFAGISSAVLTNDTVAIIGTPLAFVIARRCGVSPHPFLLGLCVAITIGSTMSPIGNPQNLLIALEGHMDSPFQTFLVFLTLPTLLSLALAFLWISFLYRSSLQCNGASLPPSSPPIDIPLARTAHYALAVIVFLICVDILSSFLSLPFRISLPVIALVGCGIVLIGAPHRKEILRTIDWSTLVFFAAMFVLMKSVWNVGLLQSLMRQPSYDITSPPSILAISLIGSQLISNVPLVALYLPLLQDMGITTKGLLLLAVGSTLAGNVFILGAASNVIVLQHADKEGVVISFFEFARAALPITLFTLPLYLLFLL